MATMKEIADLAGVSRGTVDRVLNHRGVVNAQTKKKILEIAKLLNYQPNKAGIALAAQKKKWKIGVILFGFDNPFFDEVMIGLNSKLEELAIYGCSILTKRIPFTLEAQLSTINEFLKEGVHGFILSPYNDPAIQEKIDRLYEQDIYCVTVNTDMPDSKRIAYVGSDYYKCGETAAGLLGLITNGKAKVGIVTGSHNVLCHEERCEGFSSHLSLHYPHITIVETIENEDDEYKSYALVQKLLQTHPELDALYFTAGGVHGGCQAILNEKQHQKMKVITFDAVESTKEMIRQGLITATITQQPFAQGSQSLAILVDFLLTKAALKQTLFHMDLSIMIKENLV